MDIISASFEDKIIFKADPEVKVKEINTTLEKISIQNGSVEPPGTFPFGHKMASQFLFGPKWKNLNHGSFGTYPTPIKRRLRELQDQTEAEPDVFIRYTHPKLLDESRAAVTELLKAPVDTIVFVPNASTGVDTVLRNMSWNPDGKDEVLFFTTIYGACLNVMSHLSESSPAHFALRPILLPLPLSPTEICTAFTKVVNTSLASNHRPRLALFDTISSLPGFRMPFEELTLLCKKNSILSLIDAAHGIGQIPLNLTTLDPDFLVSNAHKWLFTPRGCAIFYVPLRNQHLIKSSLPTSWGFRPEKEFEGVQTNPLPVSGKSQFVQRFDFVGTVDSTPYLCVGEALKWRKDVCGGEEKIQQYCIDLARKGGRRVAEILGTEVLDDENHNMTDCALINVRLPLAVGSAEQSAPVLASKTPASKVHFLRPGYGVDAARFIERTLVQDHNTFVPVFIFQNSWWMRLCAMIYLEEADFEWLGQAVASVLEKVGNGEYLP